MTAKPAPIAPTLAVPQELRDLHTALGGVLDGTAPLLVSQLQQLVARASDALLFARPSQPDPEMGGLAGEGNGALGG